MRAVIILDENRRRSICSWFEYLGGSAAIFFAYFFLAFALSRSSRLVSIEGDRRLEGSSAQHAMCIYAVGVYTYGIYGGSYRVNYVVYVWT